jgi:hypothetical protein
VTAEKSSLIGLKPSVEEVPLQRLRETLPPTTTKVVIIADREFGDPARWATSR